MASDVTDYMYQRLQNSDKLVYILSGVFLRYTYLHDVYIRTEVAQGSHMLYNFSACDK